MYAGAPQGNLWPEKGIHGHNQLKVRLHETTIMRIIGCGITSEHMRYPCNKSSHGVGNQNIITQHGEPADGGFIGNIQERIWSRADSVTGWRGGGSWADPHRWRLVILDHGGYPTRTTFERMNTVSYLYDLGFSIFTEDGYACLNFGWRQRKEIMGVRCEGSEQSDSPAFENVELAQVAHWRRDDRPSRDPYRLTRKYTDYVLGTGDPASRSTATGMSTVAFWVAPRWVEPELYSTCEPGYQPATQTTTGTWGKKMLDWMRCCRQMVVANHGRSVNRPLVVPLTPTLMTPMNTTHWEYPGNVDSWLCPRGTTPRMSGHITFSKT